MRSKRILYTIIVLTISGCSASASPTPTDSATHFTLTPGSSAGVLTATLQPTFTAPPTETPLPPLPTPTVIPVEGTSSTQLNVRAEPSTGSDVLGIIPPNTRVEITGKDPGGSWWQILYPAGTQEKGWVTAQYVISGSPPEVPVIGGGEANSNDGNVAIVQQQLNVRSGPGTDFNSLGTLNPQDVARLIGKDVNGSWLQIEFVAGPDGKGWISAAFVQAKGVEGLPILTESGTVIGTGTPMDTPQPPTPTLIPAPMDGDSAQDPAVNVILSAIGTRSFQYFSDISSPAGDHEDWIQFTAFTPTTLLSFSCFGTAIPTLEVLQNNSSVQEVTCGEKVVVHTTPGSIYLVQIASNSTGALQYAHYILQVVAIP